MWRFLKRYSISILIFLAVIGIAFWNWQGYQALSAGFQSLQTPIAVAAIPTATLTPIPTPSAPIPLPQGLQPLYWNPASTTLLDKDGKLIFALSNNLQWVPVVPDVLSSGFITTTLPVQNERGEWELYDPASTRLAYRWDNDRWVWDQAADLPAIAELDPQDKTRVSLKEGSVDILIAKADDQLLKIAPQLNARDYQLNLEQLIPTQVFRIGAAGDTPYVLYTDENDLVRMGWNVAEGTIEHAALASYTDNESGMTVQALVITEPQVVKQEHLFYLFQPDHVERLPKAIFEYTLAINNLYWNHRDRFFELLGSNEAHDILVWSLLGKMNSKKISALQTEALALLRSDLQNLEQGQKITIPVGDQKFAKFNRQEAFFVIRVSFKTIELVNNYNGPFRNLRKFQLHTGANNNVDIMVPGSRLNIVGGFLVELLREMTAGGASGSAHNRNSGSRRISISTTDAMMSDVCGEDVIKTYLGRIPYGFKQKGVVPSIDSATLPLPLCVIQEKLVYP